MGKRITCLCPMVARLLTCNPCVLFSGPPRPCFEFRVTSVQNNRGSGPRSNNGTGVIFGMIHFSAGLLLSVCQSSTLIVKNKSVHVSRECHNQKYIQGVQDRIKNFFEGGSDFTEDVSFGQFYLRFHRDPYELI